MAAGRLTDRRRNWLPRRLRPTREGWWFIGATLLMGMAAVNAGLNLLFAIFGMMLFMILASGVMSEWCLRNLEVRRRLPAVIHAGSAYLMGINVHNRKRRMPTFSLEVEDLTDERPVERRCYFLKIPAGRDQETAYRNRIHRRGRHLLTGFRLSTRFPFGFIRKSRDVDETVELLVFPALVPLPATLKSGALADRSARNRPVPDRSGDFSGLRDFRAGDDPRQIHWRSSAKRQMLLVRESEEDAGLRVVVQLTAGATDDADAFEQAVSMATSLALDLQRHGYQVGLMAGPHSVEPSNTPHHLRRIMTTLALIQRTECVDEPAMPPHRDATIYRVTPARPAPLVATIRHSKRGRAA